MGQYYYPIILKGRAGEVEEIKAWMNAHRYGNGLKLMEHSYIGNNFMSAFEYEIGPNGAHFMSRVVWAGDYADKEKEFGKNLYFICDESNEIIPEEKNACSRKMENK